MVAVLGCDHRIVAVSYREGVDAGRPFKSRIVADGRLGYGVVRVGYVHHLDAVLVEGCHHRIVAVAYLVDCHILYAVQPEAAGVPQLAGGEDVGRVGYVDNLYAVIDAGGHHGIRAAPHAIDGHPFCPVQQGSAVVAQVAGGGGAGRIGDIYNLYAVIDTGHHHRIVAVVRLVVLYARRAVKLELAGVGDLAPVAAAEG